METVRCGAAIGRGDGLTYALSGLRFLTHRAAAVYL
jgi:hypothetical protein